MEKQELIDFWIKSSDNDYETMLRLHAGGDYSWSLFIGHLMIEKLLKAFYIRKMDENYPLTHNLLRLAELSGLELSEEQQDSYATLTTFNINARYDDYKLQFYKKCTKAFTDEWIEKIEIERKWLKKMLLK